MTNIGKLRALLAAALLWAASALPAGAQSSPGWTYGYVPTPAQWNAAFAGKVDYTGSSFLPLSGGTMSGEIITAASTVSRAGLNLPAGTAPTAPANGDLWTTTSGLYVRINGATVGPLVDSTTPCAVCAVTNATNTFTARQVINAGTLTDGTSALSITATMPTTITAINFGVNIQITGAGSSAFSTRGFNIDYLAGYTGSSQTAAARFANGNAGTGATLIPASGSNAPSGNIGGLGNTSVTTAGYNMGIVGVADGGNVNAGVVGLAQVAKNSATNIGVVGSAINTGTSPVHIGGFFSINQTTVPTVSAALIADNGAGADAIFLGRHAGATVFFVGSDGATNIASANAACFAIGPNGSTNPVLAANCAGSSSATGVVVNGAAAGSGASIVATSSGTNEALTIRTKGTGTLALQVASGGTINVGTNASGATTINLGSGAGGVTVNIGGAGNGVNALVVANSVGGLQTWVSGGTGTVTFPAATTTLVGRDTTDTLTNKTLSAPVVTGIMSTSTINGTGTSSSCFVMGPNGTTNPTLQVDCSVASAVTGLKVTGNAAGAGVNLATISSAAAESLALNAKGSGVVAIANVSTGGVQIGAAGVASASIAMLGATSGTATLKVAAVAGTTNFQLPVGNGTSGQFLQTDGAGNTSWQSAAGAGTVTSVAAGTGMSFTTITASGSVAIDKATAANLEAGTSNKVLTADIIYDAAVAITFNATQTWDFSTFLNATETLTANITSLTCSNIKSSQSGVIKLTQDATGSRTMVAGWCSQFRWANGTRGVLSTAANAVDSLYYQCSSATVCDVSLGKAMAN